MELNIRNLRNVFKNTGIFLLVLIFLFISFKLVLFYIPFLIGFIISLVIEPIIRLISTKTGITRKSSAIIVLIFIFILIISLTVWGIITIISESTKLLQNLDYYIEKAYVQIQEYIESMDLSRIKIPEQLISLIENKANSFLEFLTNWISNLLSTIIQIITSLPGIFIYIIITILSTYFICADKLYILDQFEYHFPRKWVNKINKHFTKIVSTLGNYLKAELILILISFIQVLIGLYVFKWIGLNVTYPLLCALGIGFVDALPILRFGMCYNTMGNNFIV